MWGWGEGRPHNNNFNMPATVSSLSDRLLKSKREIRTAHACAKLGALWTLPLQKFSNFEASSVSVHTTIGRSGDDRRGVSRRVGYRRGLGEEKGREVVKP